MSGLGVLFVIGLYIFLANKILKTAKTTLAKAIVWMLILLVPTSDAIYGRIKLKQMCKAEAGLKVYRVAEHVDGFMTHSFYDYWVKEHGYNFTEEYFNVRPVLDIDQIKVDIYKNRKQLRRYSMRDGQVNIEQVNWEIGNTPYPKSQYRFSEVYYELKDTFGRGQYLITDLTTAEILATDTVFGFNGGWAERLLAAFSDGGIKDRKSVV